MGNLCNDNIGITLMDLSFFRRRQNEKIEKKR